MSTRKEYLDKKAVILDRRSGRYSGPLNLSLNENKDRSSWAGERKSQPYSIIRWVRPWIAVSKT
jgi:hypothetical protein